MGCFITYEYTCSKCAHTFDVIKPAREMENEEHCPECKAVGNRHFFPRTVFFSGTKVQEAEFNPGLGAVVRNKEHRAEIAKRKGLVEVGNDYGSGTKLDESFAKAREEKRQREWEAL